MMKFMIFEGSTAEFLDIAASIGLNPPPTEDAASMDDGAVSADEFTVEQVKSVLSRRPMAEPMKAMLKQLYESGDKRISSDEIKDFLEFNSDQFRGMLGAFGRRVANTEGVPVGIRLLDEHWDHELRQKTWSLPSNVRKALEELGLA